MSSVILQVINSVFMILELPFDSDRPLWHLEAVFGLVILEKDFCPNDPKSKCMCGLVFPSRPHLVWNCPVTADLRCDIIPPQNRVEERLFARCISEMPAPPPVPDNQVFNSLCESILCIGQQTSVVHIATDGSSKHNVGAWSIVLQGNTHGFAGPAWV